MGATLEVLVGILRTGPDHDVYGDPYTHSGTVILNGETLTIKGMTAGQEASLLDEREAVRLLFIPYGVKWVVWERRRRGGKVKHVELRINYDPDKDDLDDGI